MRSFKNRIDDCLRGKKLLTGVVSLTLAVLLCLFCCIDSVCAADSTSASAADPTSAFAGDPAPTEHGWPFKFRFARRPPPSLSPEELRQRPLLHFRSWANQPLPPVLSFLFILFVTIVVSEILPSQMETARRYYVAHYWRSLWSGILGCLMFTTSARLLFLSDIGTPLATLCMGVLQLLVLIGVAISSTLIGQTILSLVPRKPAAGAGKRQWFERLAAPLVGSLLLALLLIIPPLGILPRIGIRLIMLLSFLGMGALFRTGMGTKELGGSSEK